MDELRVVAQLMRLGGVVLLLVVGISTLHVRKIAWFTLGMYGVATTTMTAATVEFSTLDDALIIVGYLSVPVATCLSFAAAIWHAND